MFTNLVYVFMGGGLGSLLRFSISLLVLNLFKTTFVISTLISNIVSCFILALSLFVFSAKFSSDTSLRLLIITGFCGGFSTFSAFSHETVTLLKAGQYPYAILNVVLNLVFCFAAMWFFIPSK